MIHTITTITDAIRLVSDWTERYIVPPTDEQIHRAAAALVEHLGGWGNDYDSEESPEFDLDAALEAPCATT